MVIARLLRTALLLQAARVLPSGKPTMDSRGILLALDLENGKRPCADYGGGSDQRCKYYSHGTLANEMARPCRAGSNSLAIFVLKLREFTSSRPCDRGVAPAIREAEALGFIRVIERGRGGNADPRDCRYNGRHDSQLARGESASVSAAGEAEIHETAAGGLPSIAARRLTFNPSRSASGPAASSMERLQVCE